MSLLWVCFFQTITIGWFFGAEKFCDCVEQMTGNRPGYFWFICWKFLAPAVMLVRFFYKMQGPDYEYYDFRPSTRSRVTQNQYQILF